VLNTELMNIELVKKDEALKGRFQANVLKKYLKAFLHGRKQ